jgi:hypothetical protein
VLEIIPQDDKFKRAADVSGPRRDQIIGQLHEWMPNFRELLVGGAGPTSELNFTAGLHRPKTQQLLLNMTHYVQLFAVAVEQMLYDRRFFYSDLARSHQDDYKPLQDYSQVMLCEARNLMNVVGHWQRSRREFDILHRTEKPEVDEGIARFYDKLIANRLDRDREFAGQFQGIESPLDRAWQRLTIDERNSKLRQLELLLPENMVKKDWKYLNTQPERRPQPVIVNRLAYPRHFWRDIMPLAQRQLYTAKERAIRDGSILSAMQQFLGSYKSMISNNLPRRCRSGEADCKQ